MGNKYFNRFGIYTFLSYTVWTLDFSTTNFRYVPLLIALLGVLSSADAQTLPEDVRDRLHLEPFGNTNNAPDAR